MNQRQATVSTILAVLKERGVDYELNGETSMKETLNDQDKAKVREVLFAMFRAGEVSYRSDFQTKVNDDTELKKYISGLVNNWVAKAPEFNAGQKHEIKNKGSRAGSGDETVREMKKLLSLTTNVELKAEIQAAIDSRTAEIKAAKQQVEIDFSKIPAHLRAILNK